MIEKVIERWHEFASGRSPESLDDLLDDDVVFLSPVVYTPQKGREITKLYLRAAYDTLGGDGAKSGKGGGSGGFRYTKQILQGSHAALEFETELDGKYVNGIDIITCNDEGRIVEFRVMLRPLQAVNAVHGQMKAMLEKMQSA